ncbi:MAG: PD-(D/E)XK nuclease family protein [Marinifilaceae bacterium]
MEYLLKDLDIIRKEYEMLSEREEKFNIFTILHKEHDERRLHSRFISALLQPRGTHGQGSLFLKNFISQINTLQIFPIDDCVLVYPEEKDKKENSNIDILVINRERKKCLIVENKINAGDSNLESGGQLERYIDHVVKNEKIQLADVIVIYLTMDGHEPSKESVGKYLGVKDVIICSYVELIKPWLEANLKDVYNYPFLRESLIQYLNLVNKMTGNSSSKEERLEYKKLIGSSQSNMKAAKKLFDNYKHIKWHAVHEFWSTLQAKLQNSGKCEIVKPFDKNNINDTKFNNCIADLTHYEVYRKGQKNKQKCTMKIKTDSGLIISIKFTANYNHFYFGLSKKDNEGKGFEMIVDDLIQKYNEYEKNSWMLLSKVFDNDIKFNNFHDELTFSLIDGEMKDKLIEDIYTEIIELIDRV